MAQISTNTGLKGCVESRIGGRAENQDSCGYADTPLGLLVVVCDGMGGGPGGKLASSVAVDAIIGVVKAYPATSNPRKVLSEAVVRAHETILRITAERPALRGMGSTATALLISKRSAVVAHVGDSRVYQFRRKGKKFRTSDHSVVFELVKNGTLTEEQARLSSQSNVITRALGHGDHVLPDIAELPYERGDRFMLCTDGVWGAMPEKELIDIAAGISSLEGALESLFIQVEEVGVARGNTHDNYSAALIETTQNSIMTETMSTKTRNILLTLAIVCAVSLALNTVQIVRSSKTGTAAQCAADSLKTALERQLQADSVIRALTDSVNSLRGQLTKTSNEAARFDERAKQEKERREEAETAKREAEEKAKQAEEAAKSAKATSASKQSVLDQLSTIQSKVEGLKKNGKNRGAVLKELSTRVSRLEDSLKKYGQSVSQMNRFIKAMEKGNRSAYDEMIQEVKALKLKVEKHK